MNYKPSENEQVRELVKCYALVGDWWYYSQVIKAMQKAHWVYHFV